MSKSAGVDVSRSVQDYLKAIYKLQSGAGPVQTSALAEQLGVAPPSATNMVGRLAESGLIRYTRYHGVELTEKGAAIALEVIRHHRLWELFLHRALGLSIDQLHEEAERLEHELSDVLEEHIVRHLGDPTLDPHGDPIPSIDGRLLDPTYPLLSQIDPGNSAIVRRVPDSDPALLRYLGTLGLLPGATVSMIRREPFNGPLTVHIDGMERILGNELASCVYVDVGAVTT